MHYDFKAIADEEVPRAINRGFQHTLDIYSSESNKVISTWRCLRDGDLSYRPHPKSSSVLEILRHQLLSERRFFGEFLGCPEPAADQVLPGQESIEGFWHRMRELAVPRLVFLAAQDEPWWLTAVPFFDETRSRIWVFWRRVLHTCHHRTQLTVYLRLLDRPVPPTYGPTADATWEGADPTATVDAARRK